MSTLVIWFEVLGTSVLVAMAAICGTIADLPHALRRWLAGLLATAAAGFLAATSSVLLVAALLTCLLVLTYFVSPPNGDPLSTAAVQLRGAITSLMVAAQLGGVVGLVIGLATRPAISLGGNTALVTPIVITGRPYTRDARQFMGLGVPFLMLIPAGAMILGLSSLGWLLPRDLALGVIGACLPLFLIYSLITGAIVGLPVVSVRQHSSRSIQLIGGFFVLLFVCHVLPPMAVGRVVQPISWGVAIFAIAGLVGYGIAHSPESWRPSGGSPQQVSTHVVMAWWLVGLATAIGLTVASHRITAVPTDLTVVATSIGLYMAVAAGKTNQLLLKDRPVLGLEPLGRVRYAFELTTRYGPRQVAGRFARGFLVGGLVAYLIFFSLLFGLVVDSSLISAPGSESASYGFVARAMTLIMGPPLVSIPFAITTGVLYGIGPLVIIPIHGMSERQFRLFGLAAALVAAMLALFAILLRSL